jgi:predicted RNA-binding protein with PUA-like domain
MYWLMKSDGYFIDDLARDKKTCWDGVRNYQARNFMRDRMQVGDLALFYHSNADPSGVAGIIRICAKAHADFTAWDPKDKHYDPKSTKENPIWMMADVEYVEKFPRFVSISDLRKEPKLKTMLVLKRAQRLSIQPVDKDHFELICKMGRRPT